MSVTKIKHQYNSEYRTLNMIGERPGYHFSEQRRVRKHTCFKKHTNQKYIEVLLSSWRLQMQASTQTWEHKPGSN